MKSKLQIFVLTIGLIAFTGCSIQNDNDNNTSYDPTDPLNGVWNLTRAVSGWNSYPEIEEGSVTFEFDTDNSTFTITNNLVEDYPLPNSGVHSYEIVTFEDNNYIIIGNGLDFDGLAYGPKIEGDETSFYIDYGRLGRIDHSRYVTDAAIWSFER